jgi:hypothetical protein
MSNIEGKEKRYHENTPLYKATAAKDENTKYKREY